MKDLKGIKGKYYIARLIEEGEHEHQDFKFAISDARKIARSISAFANNDGGRLLVGVKDNGVIAGVRNEEDIYVIEQAAEMYCEPRQGISVTSFVCEGGAIVFRVEIPRSTVRPVTVKEADGSRRAYYRVKDENISAPPLMVKAWRQSATPCGRTLSLSAPEQKLLEMCAGGTTLDDFVIAARISRATGEEIVVSLYGMGVIDFAYDGSRFNIILKNHQ